MSFRRGRGAWFFPSTSSMRPPPSWKLINYLYHLMFSPFLPFFRCRSSCFSSHRYPYSCYPMRERMEVQGSNFSGKHRVMKIKQSKKSQSYHLLISLFPSCLKWTYRVGTRLRSFLAEREVAKLRFSLTLLYRGFLMNEAKGNRSDCVWGHSFGGRSSEWANLEVSSPHAAISIHSRKS